MPYLLVNKTKVVYAKAQTTLEEQNTIFLVYII